MKMTELFPLRVYPRLISVEDVRNSHSHIIPTAFSLLFRIFIVCQTPNIFEDVE